MVFIIFIKTSISPPYFYFQNRQSHRWNFISQRTCSPIFSIFSAWETKLWTFTFFAFFSSLDPCISLNPTHSIMNEMEKCDRSWLGRVSSSTKSTPVTTGAVAGWYESIMKSYRPTVAHTPRPTQVVLYVQLGYGGGSPYGLEHFCSYRTFVTQKKMGIDESAIPRLREIHGWTP